MSFTTVMYGGAPDPQWQRPRQPVVPDPPTITTGGFHGLTLSVPEPVRLRVSVMVEADGTVRLKVMADDRLVVETSGRGTITVESEVGR